MVKQADQRQVRDHQIREIILNHLKRWGGLSARRHNKPWTAEQLKRGFSSDEIARWLVEQGVRVTTKEIEAIKRTMKEFDIKTKPATSRRGFTLNPFKGPTTPAHTVRAEAFNRLASLMPYSGNPPHSRAYTKEYVEAQRAYDAAKAKAPYRLEKGLRTASKAAPYARTAARVGGTALMPLLAAGAINDTKEDWNLENLGYLGHAQPWLETARTAAGLNEATPDMFDEVGSGAFWKALPGEILNSGLHTGAEMGKSIGRLGRDVGVGLGNALTDSANEIKARPKPPQSASYDQIGQTKAYH